MACRQGASAEVELSRGTIILASIWALLCAFLGRIKRILGFGGASMQRFQLMRLRMILDQVESAIKEEDAKPPPAEAPAPTDEVQAPPKSDVRVVVGTTAMAEEDPGLVAAATRVINRACETRIRSRIIVHTVCAFRAQRVACVCCV